MLLSTPRRNRSLQAAPGWEKWINSRCWARNSWGLGFATWSPRSNFIEDRGSRPAGGGTGRKWEVEGWSKGSQREVRDPHNETNKAKGFRAGQHGRTNQATERSSGHLTRFTWQTNCTIRLAQRQPWLKRRGAPKIWKREDQFAIQTRWRHQEPRAEDQGTENSEQEANWNKWKPRERVIKPDP